MLLKNLQKTQLLQHWWCLYEKWKPGYQRLSQTLKCLCWGLGGCILLVLTWKYKWLHPDSATFWKQERFSHRKNLKFLVPLTLNSASKPSRQQSLPQEGITQQKGNRNQMCSDNYRNEEETEKYLRENSPAVGNMSDKDIPLWGLSFGFLVCWFCYFFFQKL